MLIHYPRAGWNRTTGVPATPAVPATPSSDPNGWSSAYFACIKNFPNGVGYVVECHDGMYSKSGGRQGACSYHDGVWRPLYTH